MLLRLRNRFKMGCPAAYVLLLAETIASLSVVGVLEIGGHLEEALKVLDRLYARAA